MSKAKLDQTMFNIDQIKCLTSKKISKRVEKRKL